MPVVAVVDLVPNPFVHAAPAAVLRRDDLQLLRCPPASRAVPTGFLCHIRHPASSKAAGPGWRQWCSVDSHAAVLGFWGTDREKKKDVVANILFVAGIILQKGPGDWFIHCIDIRRLSSRDCTIARETRIAPDTSPSIYARQLLLP
jgi:hypothetical protein